MFRNVRAALSYSYRLPWCVPDWSVKEYTAALSAVIGGSVTTGSAKCKFESRAREFSGSRYCLGVNRASTAIMLALKAMSDDFRKEVIVPSYLCPTVISAIENAGCSPVFVDIGPDFQILPSSVVSAFSPTTLAVVVPHLFGESAEIESIIDSARVRGIRVIDDAAQSFGASRNGRLVGNFGDCSVVSCGPGKALSGSGGGLLLTSDENLYRKALAYSEELAPEPAWTVVRRVLSFWLTRRCRRWTLPMIKGIEKLRPPPAPSAPASFRLSNLEAAIALCQLESLTERRRRRLLSQRLILEVLGQLRLCIAVVPGPESFPLKLVLRCDDREAVLKALSELGLECSPGFTPCHFKRQGRSVGLQNTERNWKQAVWVPINLNVPF